MINKPKVLTIIKSSVASYPNSVVYNNDTIYFKGEVIVKKRTVVIIMIVISVLLVGCKDIIKKEVSDDIIIEKDNAEKLAINLEIGYGIVDISSGADDWVNGTIDYNYSSLEPDVTYKLNGEKGKVTIDQPKKSIKKIKRGKLKNDWDLALTNEIPIDLKVSTGAADTSLDLQGVKLQKLDIESGVGRTTVDLSGSWEESFDVNLEMGVGESTIILPREVGVEIKAEKGIGSTNMEGFISKGEGVYVNDAFDHADVIITVDAEMGVGEANFVLGK